jgi:hypothetical protein
MKNLCVFILGWGMLIAQESLAQESLAQGVQPYAVNWSHTDKQTLLVGGPDTPGPKVCSALPAGTKGPSHEVTDDSIGTSQAYNPDVPEQTDPADPIVADAMFMYPNPTSGIVQACR